MTQPTLSDAIARLRAYRQSLGSEGGSGLTAADLDVILAHLDHTEARVEAEDAIADKLGDLA